MLDFSNVIFVSDGILARQEENQVIISPEFSKTMESLSACGIYMKTVCVLNDSFTNFKIHWGKGLDYTTSYMPETLYFPKDRLGSMNTIKEKEEQIKGILLYISIADLQILAQTSDMENLKSYDINPVSIIYSKFSDFFV